MRSLPFRVLFFLFLTGFLFSCSKISNSNNMITCSFSYTTTKPLSKDQRVQYVAGTAGTGGTMSSVTYMDSAGITTIQNPTLPFLQYVNLKKGVYPTISAKGTANFGGQLLIYISADSLQSGNSCNN